MASDKCAALLADLATDNAIVELDQLDPTGRIGGSGKTFLREFDRETNVVTVEVPTKNGRPLAIGQGDLARIFIVHDTGIFKFESVVLDRQISKRPGSPLPVLLLEAPERLENGNRRRHFRVQPLAAMPASITWRLASYDAEAKNKRPWNKARIIDISGRGIGAAINPDLAKEIEVGRLIELTLKLSTTPNPIQIKAVLRRAVPSADGVRDVIWGLEFDLPAQDPDACLEQVVSYVTHCQIEVARVQRERES